MANQTATLIVDKWVIRRQRVVDSSYPAASSGWEILASHEVPVRLTAKRIHVISGTYKGKVFDRPTGREIIAQKYRRGSMYRYRIEVWESGN